jgi:DNA-binding response OmpR family regulator
MDVMMPMMDGFEACEAVRKHPKFRSVPVLFLSALNTKADIMKGYDAGANLFLTKPFDPSRLLRNVEVSFTTNPVTEYHKRYTLEELVAMENSGPEALAKAESARADTERSEDDEPTARRWVPSERPAATAKTASDQTRVRPRVLVVDDESDLR